MIRNVMTDMGMTLGPTVALLLFVLLFILVMLWIYRPGSREIYEEEARLPLDDASTPSRIEHAARDTTPTPETGLRPHAEN